MLFDFAASASDVMHLEPLCQEQQVCGGCLLLMAAVTSGVGARGSLGEP